MAPTSTRAKAPPTCDVCGERIPAGAHSGTGTHLTVRGDRVQHEELPLCERCALSIGMTFLVRLATEEDEG